MTEQTQQEMPEVTVEDLREQSMQVGQNIMAFLDAIKLSAKTAEERQTLNVFISTSEVVERLAKGELVLVSSQALQPPQTEADPENGDEE